MKYKLSFPSQSKAADANSDVTAALARYKSIHGDVDASDVLGDITRLEYRDKYDDKTRIIMNTEIKTVQKSSLLVQFSERWYYISMNTVELKFWDRLGYVLHPEYARATGQSIEDWFE